MNPETTERLIEAAKDGTIVDYDDHEYHEYYPADSTDEDYHDWRSEWAEGSENYEEGISGGWCNMCQRGTTSPYWCNPCNSFFFTTNDNFVSGNDIVDTFIREVRLAATSRHEILEWIPYSNFEDISYLDEGGFGKVYKANWNDGFILYQTGRDFQWKRKGITKVALKCLNDPQIFTEEFLNEIKNLHKCNDNESHITRCYGITKNDDTNSFMIVMQYVDDGNLRNLLPDIREKSWADKLMCLFRIAKGLHQIHSAGLVHRNFHGGNILLSDVKNNALYITDLGLCRPIDEYVNTNGELENQNVYGVLPYVAPEVLCGREYTKAADVYAFGIIMSEVLSGIPSFNNVPHDNDLAIQICGGLRPKIHSNTPDLIVELVQRCLDADPSRRPSADELYSILRVWRKYSECSDSELAKQIQESERVIPNPLDIENEAHPLAVYTSRLLNFSDLPEPENSEEFIRDSESISSD